MLFTHSKKESGGGSYSQAMGFQPIVDRTTEFKRHKQKSSASAATIIPIQQSNQPNGTMLINNNQSNQSDSSNYNNNPQVDLETFIFQTRQVREWLSRLKQLTQSIENMHRQTLMAVSIDEAKKLTAIIDAQVAEHQTTAGQVRNALKHLGERAATTRDKRIQAVTVQKLGKEFLERMVAFREMQTTYQSKYKSQLERQYLIVRPTATRVELDRLADVENPLVLSQQVQKQIVNCRCSNSQTWPRLRRHCRACRSDSMRSERSSRA